MIKSLDLSLDFLLLLIYSLLPGIYKIAGSQILMLGCIPIIMILLYKHRKDLVLAKFDIAFIFFIIYLVGLLLVQQINSNTNKIGLYMGFFLDIIPMSGFFYSKSISFETFVKNLLTISTIHCIFAIFLYPPFNLNSIYGNLAPTLLEGVAFGRMSSVSGSLGFGSLMMMAFICALNYNKKLIPLFLIGIIFSAQRSSWIASTWGVVVILIALFKQYKWKYLSKYLLIFTSIMTIVFFILVYVVELDLSFIIERFNDLGNATNERESQWINGFHNFQNSPIGTGMGQVGQVAARYEEGNYFSIPDGDYFRVISEYGIGGIFIYSLILFFVFILLWKLKLYSVNDLCIISICGGLLIQMIGSNVSEFYFNNFIYWALIGYLFSIANKNIKSYDISMHRNI